MNHHPLPHFTRTIQLSTLLLLILLILLSGCSGDSSSEPGITDDLPSETEEGQPALPLEAEITFIVEIPANTPPFEPIHLTILDEVTGLALNVKHYEMQVEDNLHLSVKIQAPIGSTLKYRYTRQADLPAVEHSSDGRSVRYRLYHVYGPGIVQDIVSRWNDTSFQGEPGRIVGTAIDDATGEPVPGLLATAGGVHSISRADGTFLLEGLPQGTHNLVIYSLDGGYQVFQQGAVIASGSTTPATIRLNKSQFVSVSLTVTVPDDSLKGLPLRVAGNLYQLGNTYANLSGGISTLASRMPMMDYNPSTGQYSLNLSLPAGVDVRYKYTLGDGFWNAERMADGGFRTRQLIIPPENLTIEDVVTNWQYGDNEVIWFKVTVPGNTPPTDTISLQINPFSWTEPIPMWPIGNNQWVYALASPLDLMNTISYRYCRNDQCGNADDAQTAGQSNGRTISIRSITQHFEDTVSDWQWLPDSTQSTVVPNDDVQLRDADFMAGVEFTQNYHPSWASYENFAFAAIESMQANWVVLTPTWSFITASPLRFEQTPGTDPLWQDISASIQLATERGLSVALYPYANFSSSQDNWWNEAPLDPGWWETWFDKYQQFIIHHAKIAADQDLSMFVIGGDWILPAMPAGNLPSGLPSRVPEDADLRWRTLIHEIRQIYNGDIAWALSYPESVSNPPTIINTLDKLYILWDPVLSTESDPALQVLETRAKQLLETEIASLHEDLDISIILAIGYPSADGANTGCIVYNQDRCLDPHFLSRPYPDFPEVLIDLQEQADIYNAIFSASNDIEWIDGIVSQGYYPPASLQDKSESVNGKFAADIIWYWFSNFFIETQ